MISTPDPRKVGLALAVALAGAALLIAPVTANPGGDAIELIAKAKEELANNDGIAAEADLRRAMERGTPREAVAAYMGEALIAQKQLDKAHDWLAPGQFSQDTQARGFRTLAQLEQMQGDLAAAGSAYDRVITLTPKDPTLWVEIARLRYAGGEHSLALDAANYSEDLDPKNVRVLELRGQLIRDQYGLVAALPWFEAALARDPKDVSVLAEYAATLGDLGRAKDMLAVTRKLLEVDPGNPRAFYLQAVLAARVGNSELARGLMNRTRGRLEGMPAATLLEGVLELQAGNYVLATEAFEELVREQPGNQRAMLLLMRALYLSGEYKQLVIRFADDADAHDASPYLWTVLARSYEALGQRDRAAPLLDRAASVGAAQANFRPSVVADADAEQTRTDNPGNFDSQANAGDAQLAQGNGEAALERYRLAARIRMPESLMLRMVAAYGLVGQNAQARALLETYLAENPRSEAAGRLAARYSADAGDWQRARLLLENLVANGADRDVRVLSELSVVQLRSGDAPAAEATARQAYQVQRASPLAAEVWGLSLATTGRRPYAARSLLAKAARFFGNSPLIAEARRQLAKRRDG